MQEKTIENKLVQAVKEMGNIAPKFVRLGGMIDPFVLFPFGRVGFLAVKCRGKKAMKDSLYVVNVVKWQKEAQVILQEALERGVFSHFQWYGTLTQIEPDYLNGRWRKEVMK